MGELRSLFARAVSLPRDERGEFLAKLSISDETRDELRAMLDADGGSETYISQIVSSETGNGSGVGEVFGPFRATELLGRGGMGVVFKANRVDGELSQTVAIKVVWHSWIDQRAVDRFRQERQVLAGLVHGNIARLLDGGTRTDGLVYLVMEYVDGLRIDEYCDQHGLGIAGRLRLFLPLCDAVEYAHRKLVVHRDLKPSNIMVTTSGEPKLLDFGVAKTLDAAGGEGTGTVAFTPDFASPEQARGEEITTATDVYGLGAVLYFLLTGQSPRATAGRSAAQIQRAISEETPARPGSLRPELQGDLENILLKALNPEAARRYPSARHLADDLQRYLSHYPVLATTDGLAYRGKRFIQRHVGASIAAGVALLVAATGIAAFLYEAHRAQQRSAQVRELSNRFIFDFEGAIRYTPGTLNARRMVASTAREYLANLAAEAGSNAALNRELAESYYSLARVEYTARETNAAVEHFQKSRQIHLQLHDDCCGPPKERLNYIASAIALSRFMIESRKPEDSVAFGNEALNAARSWYQQSPNEPLASRALALAESNQGGVLLNRQKQGEAVKLLQEADGRLESLVKQSPGDEDLSYEMAHTELWLVNVLPDAAALRAKVKASIDGFLVRHPQNTRWRNLGMALATSNAIRLTNLARTDHSLQPQGLAAYREAYTLAKVRAQQSPDELNALDDASNMAVRLANELGREKKFGEAETYYLEALQDIDQLLKVDAEDRRNRYLKENALANFGDLYGQMNRRTDEARVLAQAAEIADGVLKQWPESVYVANDLVDVRLNQTRMERALGHPEKARAFCEQAIAVAADIISRNQESKHPVDSLDDLFKEARSLNLKVTGLKAGTDANTPPR